MLSRDLMVSRRTLFVASGVLVVLASLWQGPFGQSPAAAQPAANTKKDAAPSDRSPGDLAKEKADAVLKAPAEEKSAANEKDNGAKKEPDDASWLSYYQMGGPLMWPITLLSFISILFTIERIISLRRSKVVPRGLVKQLGDLAASSGGFDPRQAYKICQSYPSSAAKVIRAMLLKVGRSNSEVEQTIQTASDLEASRLYGNIRPIALAATVAPMLGLMGTVLGMIILFHAAATPGATMDKTLLSKGIYTKLITTFAGLCVAVPSAIFTQLLEGRIISLFHDITDLTQSLVPQLERYEGKLRVNPTQLAMDSDETATAGNGTSRQNVKKS